MRLQEILSLISPSDQTAAAACQQKWDSVGKPLGSLGLLESSLCRIAALTGSPQITLEPRSLLVFCADNGVVEEGVSQTDASITRAVAEALTKGYSSACTFAKRARAEVIPIDMGILDMPSCPGLINCRVRNGTENIAKGPAMTREQAETAILYGIEQVRLQKEKGIRLIATGEMGIGNTTTSGALAAYFLNLSPEQTTGRGAGLSDVGLLRKQNAIRRALIVNAPLCKDPLGALAALGGLDIAGMTGAFLGGALYGVPVLIDGFISSVAALTAVRLCENSKKAMLATHCSGEPAGAAVLEALGLSPFITAGMRLGEGTGALASMPLLDMALDMYGGASFAEFGMEAYTPQYYNAERDKLWQSP